MPIKTLYNIKFILAILGLLFSNFSYCQHGYEAVKQQNILSDSIAYIYGKDASLFNGILYKGYYPSNIRGHQYFISTNFMEGDLQIRGCWYKDILINYDIYNQQVVIKDTASSASLGIISVSQAWLECFQFGKMRFGLFDFPNQPNHIFQIIGNDSIKILYQWSKKLQPESVNGSTKLMFITKRSSYLLINTTLKEYYNNNSFIKLFPRYIQNAIKSFISKNKVKVKTDSDETIENLIRYCNSIKTS